jgi:5-methyltetrahydropteroyltriglutamate--homocysteine methyltransferase
LTLGGAVDTVAAMPRSTDRIVTTHAGSLPRPDDVVEMIWAGIDGQPADEEALEERLETAVADIVQAAAGRPASTSSPTAS